MASFKVGMMMLILRLLFFINNIETLKLLGTEIKWVFIRKPY